MSQFLIGTVLLKYRDSIVPALVKLGLLSQFLIGTVLQEMLQAAITRAASLSQFLIGTVLQARKMTERKLETEIGLNSS